MSIPGPILTVGGSFDVSRMFMLPISMPDMSIGSVAEVWAGMAWPIAEWSMLE